MAGPKNILIGLGRLRRDLFDVIMLRHLSTHFKTIGISLSLLRELRLTLYLKHIKQIFMGFRRILFCRLKHSLQGQNTRDARSELFSFSL